MGKVTNDFLNKKNYRIQTIDIGTIGLRGNKIGHLKNEYYFVKTFGGGGYQ